MIDLNAQKTGKTTQLPVPLADNNTLPKLTHHEQNRMSTAKLPLRGKQSEQ
jgi:hypothetical protein